MKLQRQEKKMSELDEQLNVYIEEWRKQKHKEEDELKNLKERQIKRRVSFWGAYVKMRESARGNK